MFFFRALIFAVLIAVTSAAGQDMADPGIKDPSRFDPKRPLAQELRTNVADGFRVIAVGDCIISRPLSQYAIREPEFDRVLQVLKRGDAVYGNLETSILDIRDFRGYPYTGVDDVPLIADPRVAKDLAAMGFNVMSRANNHALDWGIEGMRETSRWTEGAGIVTAGTGENQGAARAARYLESAKGRIAIVSTASTFRPTSEALSAIGAAPGRPGISGLAVKKTFIVPADTMHDLRALSQKLFPDTSKDAIPGKGDNAEFTLFDTRFDSGTKRGLRYDMNAEDLAGILKSVRLGKEHSDFLLVTIHSHESADATAQDPKNDFADAPADFVHTLAKAAIDAGADAFLTTGIHHLGPIEIYKGRPIFYGLGDFFWSDMQEPMPADFYAQYPEIREAFKSPERATDADAANVLNAETFNGNLPFESVIAESRFDHNRLAEIRLYPVDLGYGQKLTESGIPRVASSEKAMAILKRLVAISSEYGTKIEIQTSAEWNYVGVIHPQ